MRELLYTCSANASLATVISDQKQSKTSQSATLATKQRAFLVDHVFRNGGKCINTVQKRFFKQLPDAEAPHCNSLGRLIKKFRQTGDVKDAS